jgi:chorismate-pyruvate lyase
MKAAREDILQTLPQPVYSDTYPLDEFYAERGETAPLIERVEIDEVPEPYHRLLGHKTDMTSTLEGFYRDTLHIEVLARRLREAEFYREVVLVLDGSNKRVEFGAIKIQLDSFPDEARRVILRGQKPLGWVLNTFTLPFVSRPGPFLRLVSDSFIESSLQLQGPRLLYGRRNSLVDARERPLAEIVEILPA